MTWLICFSVEKQVKEIMHRAFWDAFQEKITEDPPDFSQAVVLIQEVKEVRPSSLPAVLALCPPGSSADKFANRIDPDQAL